MAAHIVFIAKTDQSRIYGLLIIYYQPHSPFIFKDTDTRVISNPYTLDRDPCVYRQLGERITDPLSRCIRPRIQGFFIILKTRLISMDAFVAQWVHARLHTMLSRVQASLQLLYKKIVLIFF